MGVYVSSEFSKSRLRETLGLEGTVFLVNLTVLQAELFRDFTPRDSSLTQISRGTPETYDKNFR